MTWCVIAFLDGSGRRYCVRLHRVAPCAYGAGGSPPVYHFTTVLAVRQ